MHVNYDLNKIKFAADEGTFTRAVGLYESGKVTEVETLGGYYSAVVQGTNPYRVSVSARNYKQGHCTCYLGQKDMLCKHMVALALYAVMDGKPLNDKDKQLDYKVECSRRREGLDKEALAIIKASITTSMKHIKPYSGPSRTWFANQDSLREGCNMLSAIVSDLPVDKQTAEILVNLLSRLDRKLRVGGVDDSNGIVGGFMTEVVGVLEEFAKIDPTCIKAFESLAGKETCFEWDEPLIRILDEKTAGKYNDGLKEAEISKAFKGKKFIDAKMAGYIKDKIVEAMPALKVAFDKYGINPKDVIRFQVISETCRSEREKKGLTFKQIALALKIPQYRLKDIESSSVKDVDASILENYLDYLGLHEWFSSWKEHNPDVYKRLSKKS